MSQTETGAGRRTAPPLKTFPIAAGAPILDAATRARLGRHLRTLYDPVIDEALDPRLAELLGQLDADRAATGG